MFREIFGFELRQQLRGPLLWIFIALFFVAGIALTSSPAVQMSTPVGTVHVNAPLVIASLGGSFAFLCTLFVVVFVVGGLLRDFEQNTAETIFSTPVTRSAYLGGRLTAGFTTSTAIVVAGLVGALLGTFMPWIEPERLGPFMPGAWGWTLGVMLIPDMLFIGALLFALAAATRSLLATFIGVVALIVLRSVASAMMSGIGHDVLAGLIDPYGGMALQVTVHYWAAHAWNTQLPGLTGVLLGNRLLWLGVSAALYGIGFLLFRTQREGIQWRLRLRRRRKARVGADTVPSRRNLPAVSAYEGPSGRWRQFLSLTRLHTRAVTRGVLFAVMLLLSLALLTAVLAMSAKMYGTTVYPVTHLMVSDIKGALSLFLLIAVAFYAGELVWRDRALGVHQLVDTAPVPGGLPLLARASALVLVVLAFLTVGALYTTGYQLILGYTHLEPGVYAVGLAMAAINFSLTAILALVLQTISPNKYVGYLLFVVFLLAMFALSFLHLEHHLYQYAGTPSLPYSDLNGWGHFLAGPLWFDLYWAFFATALLVVAWLFQKHGTDNGKRWRTALTRLKRRPAWLTLVLSLAAFVVCGGWIFYNTNVLNNYTPGDEAKDHLAAYEKAYSQYADADQPRITAVNNRVDLYPHQRKFDMHVDYTLVNKHDHPIDTLYVNFNTTTPPENLEFAKHETVKRDTTLGFAIYKLDAPLQPGESMDFSFDLDHQGHGFKNNVGGLDFRLVHNGTFLTNRQLFPSFGYQRGLQLTSKKDRRKHGLDPDVPRMPPLSDDPDARANTYISHDSDWIKLDTVISTSDDQTALSPGKLVDSWHEDGRRYFHYKTDAPVLNFFVFLSGDWQVKHATWHDVDISVLYNPAHDWNVDDMIDSAKKSLDYYSKHYSPYPFDYLRIVEFPGYQNFAQSFAGTIPFSESIGFIADLRDPGDIDYPFYVTAHEVAHQWWAHQVIGADMAGSTMLSESLAQYSALMVMKHEYGKKAMRRFLKYELDMYLRGRITDRRGETSLEKVEGQSYIRYRKGSVVFYALQDYLGEKLVDAVLHQFAGKTRFQNPPYTNSRQLLDLLEKKAGSQWDSLIDDWFRKITLYDNRVKSATAHKRDDGTWHVSMKVHAAKYHADPDGKQHRKPIDIPVGIGIFGRARDDVEADEPVLYLKKRAVSDGDSTITLDVAQKPYEVGIDPYNELIDRDSGDNRKKVTITEAD